MGSPLNLTTQQTLPVNVDTGNNKWNITATSDNLPKFPLTLVSTTYSDCKLSGALEHISLDVNAQELISTMLSIQNTTEDVDIDVESTNTTNIQVPVDEGNMSGSMKECIVRISHLMDTKITQWLVNNHDIYLHSEHEGYNLRTHNQTGRSCRLPRKVKTGVSYDKLDYSSSDDNKVSSRYHRARTPNKFLPHSAPSSARLAAHHMIQLNKEHVVAEGLLNLQYGDTQPNLNSDTVTGNNTICPDVENSSLSSSGKSAPSTSTSGKSSDGNTDSSYTHSSNCSMYSSTISDSESDSRSEVQAVSSSESVASGQTSHVPVPENTEKTDLEDDVPLQDLKNKLTNTGKKKYVFKSKSFELIKRKRSRVFKCTRCDTTEKSQQCINNHFWQAHGLLSCETCDKTCNMVSALRKHMYEHSDIATKFKCKDCNKGFPFKSQLKSHRKIYLTCLEHQCIRCQKHYKSKGELTKHLVTHRNKTWKCQSPGCDY